MRIKKKLEKKSSKWIYMHASIWIFEMYKKRIVQEFIIININEFFL